MIIGTIQASSYVFKIGRGTWGKRGFSVGFCCRQRTRRREEYRVFRRLEPYDDKFAWRKERERREEGVRRRASDGIDIEKDRRIIGEY